MKDLGKNIILLVTKNNNNIIENKSNISVLIIGIEDSISQPCQIIKIQI